MIIYTQLLFYSFTDYWLRAAYTVCVYILYVVLVGRCGQTSESTHAQQSISSKVRTMPRLFPAAL